MRDPKLTHAFDQVGAFLADFAAQLGEYRKRLVAAGFTREEALQLVIGYQAAMLNGAPQQKAGDA